MADYAVEGQTVHAEMKIRPLKVLHVLDNFRIGGKEQVVKDLILGASERFVPIACALRKVGPLTEVVREAGYQVEHLDTLAHKEDLFYVIPRLLKLFSKHRIDIVNCHDIVSWYYAAIAAKLAKIKMIVHTRHGFLENDGTKVLLLSWFLSKLTDRIVAVSPEIKRTMIDREHIHQKKLHVIFNGIDIPKFLLLNQKVNLRKRLDIDPCAFVTGTITRFYKVKNIEMQLDMVDLLREKIPNLRHLIVAPIDDYGKRIKTEIDHRNLTKHIRLLGFRRDIPEILNALNVFILTSFSEGTPLVLLEAMASRCPAVVTAVGGNPCLVEHMKNGILFPVNNLHALCDAINSLYYNQSLREKLSGRAFEFVQRFSLENMNRQYEALYLS